MKHSLTCLALLASLTGCGFDDHGTDDGSESVAHTQNAIFAAPPVCMPLFPATGDFELIEDPANPSQVLFVTNVGDLFPPLSHNVNVRRIDGSTGLPIGGPTTIATNYQGNQDINGPEFILAPPTWHSDGTAPPVGLGIMYRSLAGVHVAWRQRPSTGWDHFDFKLDGTAIGPLADPQLLPSTMAGDYAGPGPSGTSGYNAADVLAGGGARFGDVNTAGPLTDVTAEAAAAGLSNVHAITAHPTDDRHVVLAGCGGACGTCGLFRGEVDGSGGMATPLSDVACVSHSTRRETVRGGVTPCGTVVWFSTEVDPATPNDNTLHVWTEDPVTQNLTALVPPIPNNGRVEHVRTITSPNELVMYYQVRQGAKRGSWYVKVDAALNVTGPTKFDDATFGTELIYLSAAGRWAYYIINFNTNMVEGCM